MKAMTFVLRMMRGMGRVHGHAADGIGHCAGRSGRVMMAMMGTVVVRAVPVLRVHMVGIADGLRSRISTPLTLVMFPVLVGMYVHLARTEERAALAKFGDEYRAYMAERPAFLPRLRPREENGAEQRSSRQIR
jgi:hypothetical protein